AAPPRTAGRCTCKPTFQAQAYDAQAGRQVWRTFPTISAAKLWRSDAQVALRRGTLRAPTSQTVAQAAEQLIAGAHDGTILDRSGKPYKPSAARGYEQRPARPHRAAREGPRAPRRLTHYREGVLGHCPVLRPAAGSCAACSGCTSTLTRASSGSSDRGIP